MADIQCDCLALGVTWYKSKVVRVHNVEAYKGSRGIAPHILNLSARWRWVVNFTPQSLYPWEITRVHIKLEAGWAPELIWTFWRRVKYFARTGIWTPDSSSRSPVTLPTTLLRPLGVMISTKQDRERTYTLCVKGVNIQELAVHFYWQETLQPWVMTDTVEPLITDTLINGHLQ